MARKPTQRPAPKQDIPSFPALKQKMCLETSKPQRTYEKNGLKLMSAFLNAEVSLRHLGMDKECDQISKVIHNKLTKIEENLNKKRELFDALIKENNVKGRPNYSNPKNYDVELRSPWAGRYVQMLEEMDKIIIKLDSLWLSGFIPSQEKHKQEKDVTRELDSFSGVLIREVNGAFEKAKAKQAEKDKAEADALAKKLEKSKQDTEGGGDKASVEADKEPETKKETSAKKPAKKTAKSGEMDADTEAAE